MKLFLCGCFLVVVVTLMSCGKREEYSFTPLTNGFGYGKYVTGYTDRKLRVDLQYQDTNGNKLVVWPFRSPFSKVQINNDLAVLIGMKARMCDDGEERLTYRLFAFQAPIPPALDITDQVLKRWCVNSGVEFTNIVRDSLGDLVKTNDGLGMRFIYSERRSGRLDVFGTNLVISWNDLDAIVSDVKTNGTLRKEKWSGASYLQKD